MSKLLPLALFALLLLSTANAQALHNSAQYPPRDVRGPAPLPAWVATYNAAKAAGRIPDFPPTTLVNGNPAYPAGVTGGPGPTGACSWTTHHCFNDHDVVDAPTGIFGVSFDDGPQPPSVALLRYLNQVNQTATHFVIGSRIVDYPEILREMVRSGGQIGVHTWAHPYMTTLDDMAILGELGWTLQVILDATGLVPTSWRPPYGDVDDRVRSIAKEVFGLLYTVVWNQDSFDWCLAPGSGSTCVGFGPTSDAALDTTMRNFASAPKRPGLIPLEHESSDRSVAGFTRNFQAIRAGGWRTQAIGDIWNVPWYQNAANNFAAVTPGFVIGAGSLTATNATSNITVPLTTVLSSSTVRIATPTSEGALVTAQQVVVTSKSTVISPPTSTPSSSPIPTRAPVSAGLVERVGLVTLLGIAGVVALV